MKRPPRTVTSRRLGVAALLLGGVALLTAACGGGGFDDSRLQEFDDQLTTDGQRHLAGAAFRYPTTPPYAGPHDGVLTRCGVYQQQQRFENTVHTMEHGAIIIWYQPGLGGDDVATLTALGIELLEEGNRIVVSPHQQLQDPVVVASWGRLLRMDAVEEDTIRDFANTFEGDSPETNATC